MIPLIIPLPWVAAPSYPVYVDLSHPLTRGLHTAYLSGPSGSYNAFSPLPEQRITLSNPGTNYFPAGYTRGERVVGGQPNLNTGWSGPTRPSSAPQSFSTLIRCKPYAENTTEKVAAIPYFYLYLSFGDGSINKACIRARYGASVTTVASDPTTHGTTDFITYVLVHQAGVGDFLYRNGLLVASYVNAGDITSWVGNGTVIFRSTNYVTHGYHWTCALTPDEAMAISLAPNDILLPENGVVFFSGGGAAAALAGAAAGVASASGVLTTQIPLAGAAAVVSTAAGAISTAIPLDGQAAGVSLAAGVLTTQISLSGAALAQAVAQANLSTGSRLTGASAGEAAAAASLTTQISLSGAALAQVLAQANLSAGSGLTGAAAGQAAASASLLTEIPLAGSAQATTTAAGGLTTIIPLAGAAASVSSASGDLTIEITLVGAALAEALAGGDLTTLIRLDGAALAEASAAGSLGVATRLPAHIPHLVEAANGDWAVQADYGPFEVAA